jgi:transporter family protein
MTGTPFYVPALDWRAHLFTILKSVIVLSSWIFAYISLKHLPISVVSPMQATRPMWTLVGALLIFGERLNTWQWIGVSLAIGTVFVFSFFTRHPRTPRKPRDPSLNKYYIALALAILIGACSGLYDKYLMRRYDHNAVQVYYTFYQAIMMLITWAIVNKKTIGQSIVNRQSSNRQFALLFSFRSLCTILRTALQTVSHTRGIK